MVTLRPSIRCLCSRIVNASSKACVGCSCMPSPALMIDRKSTRLNSSHTEIYTLSLHDALPIYGDLEAFDTLLVLADRERVEQGLRRVLVHAVAGVDDRSEEHTSELQSHRDLHSFPTRRSSDLW